jgi:hypothetical protein
MARNHRFQQHGKRKGKGSAAASRPPPLASNSVERRPATVYGNPITILEAADKSTFVFNNGDWVPYSMTIAECREACHVTELPQKVRQMTRYEVRPPVQ